MTIEIDRKSDIDDPGNWGIGVRVRLPYPYPTRTPIPENFGYEIFLKYQGYI